MGIGSVNDYAGILQNYKVPVIPEVSLDALQSQDENVLAAPVTEVSHETPDYSPRIRNDAALEDISLVFNKKDDFGYIGKDSDIHSLDMEKAIDDMKKDRVLQQYQYFVGGSHSLISEKEEGTVIRKL